MGNLRIHQITVEHMNQPVGIDSTCPRFCWKLENNIDSNVMQQAYQIIISTVDSVVVCDTGKCVSQRSIEIIAEGFEAKPKTRYEVKIKVWDSINNYAENKTYFETGFLNEKWKASWYEPVQVPTESSADFDGEMDFEIGQHSDPNRDYKEFQPVQYIRIPFTVGKQVESARIYMTTHGVYKLQVNGYLADEREFAPDNTAYQKFLQYQTYDITSNLTKGRNVIGIRIADGWWCGRIGATGDSCQYGNKLGLLIQTEILYTDGTKEILTGKNGVSATGPLIFSDIFVGEKYDATKELSGWEFPDYDDKEWKSLNKAEYSFDNLFGQYGEPVRVVRELRPLQIIHTPAGETVLDVGQVLAGKIEWTVTAEAGRLIKFEHSEVLDKEGNFYNNILGANKDQTDIYITKEGTQTHTPAFTYHGFRYVKITGWPGEPELKDFRVYALSSYMDEIGSFETSDPQLNQLQKNIVWSQISNTLSIPTDCPQRERAGWTGDIMAFAPTMCFNRESNAFLTRWMQSVRADQLPNGAVPDVVPYMKAYQGVNKLFGTDTSCGWGDAVIIVPLAVYRAYGDTKILEQNYEAMIKWMNYIYDRTQNHHPDDYAAWDKTRQERSKYLWNTDFHFGDWLVPSMVLGNPDGGAMMDTAFATKDIVAPAYYAFSARSMKAVAEALGKKEDAAYYQELYEKIREAFIEEYVSAEGLIEPDLQGIYVIALKNGLVTDELRPKMVLHLCELIEKNGNCLDTGFLSVLFLMDVLCENGCRDYAYKLLYQKKCPSWLYEVEHGATTMWESWGAVLEDGTVSTYSYNHYAFGCIGEWLYREIGGLQALEPGYKKIRFAPDLKCGLESAGVSEITPYGKAMIHWKLNQNRAEVKVEVPVNTTAEIALPGMETQTVGSGKYIYETVVN